MRFRTDGWHFADLKASGMTFEEYGDCFRNPEERAEAEKNWNEVPKAEPGDVWRVRWSKEGGDGPIAGYAIGCIICGRVHTWTSARNCSGQKTKHSYTNREGQVVEYEVCEHSGVSSCWQWSGSAEEGTLTASPSLMVIQSEDQPCNFHGHLVDGDIHDG